MRSEQQQQPAGEEAVDVSVRPAGPGDVDALTSLFVASREAAYPEMPRPVHPPDEVRGWMRHHLDEPGSELWLAERDARPAGFLLLEDAWVHSLYVAPSLLGQGIGSLLLELAKSRRPRRLGLWVFESNVRALRFYRRHGFVEVRRTDGSDNEERAPDVEMTWPDPASVAGLRSRIDDLDDQLAAVLSARAEVTALVQRLKPVPGHAGRDRVREAEIVERMARLAPGLGRERLRRIMDTVISESLDAAEHSQPAATGQPAQPRRKDPR
jgi:GNAT superfamily N-acetyltransferase/chorismate mutase